MTFSKIFILVQVRVPTHEDGTCLFWEFATDNYDLGFGVYFEWTIAPSNQVSVQVSESSDEEELEEEEGELREEVKDQQGGGLLQLWALSGRYLNLIH